MNNIRKMGALLGAGAVIFSLAGCGDKNGDGQAESPMKPDNVGGAVKDNLGDTANAVKSGVGAVGNAVSGAVGTAGNVASNAGNAVANGADKMGGAMSNAGTAATMTPAIKTALGANAGMKGSNINVDTKDGAVSLMGTVKSEAQKKMAEAIAKKSATGMTVKNMLTVAK